ncbi:MAG: VRR-NUC domain-containing protein, partial [Spirosomataceae bacterium]
MPEKIELEPKYYLGYFHYLLGFVEKKYAHILNESENAFLSDFAQLSENEQCLYVRFSNRRASFFRTDKLKYAE